MIALAVIVFAITALGGLFLARQHFINQPLPANIAIVHGAAGAIGIVVLAIAAISQDVDTAAIVALILFVVAALGGFYLVSFHLRGVRHPSPIILVHAAIAVIAFVTLLVTIF